MNHDEILELTRQYYQRKISLAVLLRGSKFSSKKSCLELVQNCTGQFGKDTSSNSRYIKVRCKACGLFLIPFKLLQGEYVLEESLMQLLHSPECPFFHAFPSCSLTSISSSSSSQSSSPSVIPSTPSASSESSPTSSSVSSSSAVPSPSSESLSPSLASSVISPVTSVIPSVISVPSVSRSSSQSSSPSAIPSVISVPSVSRSSSQSSSPSSFPSISSNSLPFPASSVISPVTSVVPPLNSVPSASRYSQPSAAHSSTQSSSPLSAPVVVAAAPSRRKKFLNLGRRSQARLLKQLQSLISKTFMDSPLVTGYDDSDRQSIYRECLILLSKENQDDDDESLSPHSMEGLTISLLEEVLRQIQKRSYHAVRILSILYPYFTRKAVNHILSKRQLPKISKYFWRKSHIHLEAFGPGAVEHLLYTKSNCVTKTADINNAFAFLNSSEFFKSLSWGTHKLRLSNGSTLEIPNRVRVLSKERIWLRYLQEFPVSSRLSRKLFFFMIDSLGSAKDKILAALDTTSVKYGSDNFIAIRDFVILLTNHNLELRASILSLVTSVEDYLKQSFKLHCCEESPLQCSNFGHGFGELGNPVQPFVCPGCFEAITLMEQLGKLVNGVSADLLLSLAPNSIDDLRTYASRLCERMFVYIAHQFRVAYESETLQEVQDTLQVDEILIVLDWKMKLLVMLYRESQVQYFGKRGICVMGGLVIRRKTPTEIETEKRSGEFESDHHVEFFDLLADHVKEDCFTSFSALECILKNLKNKEGYNHVSKCIVFSDGAACFGGGEFLVWLSTLGQTTGIRCIRQFISESGEGKTILDGHFAHLKSFLTQKVMEGQGELDVLDSASAVRALTHNGGISNTTTSQFLIDDNRRIEIAKIDGSQSFHDRRLFYDEEGSLLRVDLAAQSYRVVQKAFTAAQFHALCRKGTLSDGTGACMISSPDFDKIPPRLGKKRKLKFAISTYEKEKKKKISLERLKTTKNKKKKNWNLISSTQASNQLHYCPRPHCAACFVHAGNLRKHLASNACYYGKSLATNTNKSRLRKTKNGEQKMWAPPKERSNPEFAKDQVILAAEKGNKSLIPRKKCQAAGDYGEKIEIPKKCFGIQSLFPAGFAKLKSPKSIKKTIKQLKFVQFWLEIGDKETSGKNASKVSPDIAAKLMKIVGTNEGESKFPNRDYMKATPTGIPLFTLPERMDSWTLRGYASTPIKKIKKQIKNLLKKAQKNNATEAEVEEEEDDDDEDSEENNEEEFGDEAEDSIQENGSSKKRKVMKKKKKKNASTSEQKTAKKRKLKEAEIEEAEEGFQAIEEEDPQIADFFDGSVQQNGSSKKRKQNNTSLAPARKSLRSTPSGNPRKKAKLSQT